MLLKADKVAKSFDGFTAVRGADLEVVQGEIVGLIGQFCPIPIAWASKRNLCSAEIRQARGRSERKSGQLRVRVVDDFGPQLDPILGGSAGARRVAGEGVDHADPYVIRGMG